VPTSSIPVALVTGAARGIGKAIASKLASQGTRVILIDIDEAACRAACDDIASLGGHASFIAADVGNTVAVQSAMGKIADEFGRLDWLVNNAGISFFRTLDDLTVDEFDRVIDVNLRAAFLFAKFGAPLLRNSAFGAIVNVSSTRALMSEPGNEAYAASKAGLIGLTHALANSLGPRIRVNAICPGWVDVGKHSGPLRPIDHSQHPAGRVGQPDDIAALVGFLLSKEAAFITGQVFVADGGMTKKMIYED
jgi:NAD(P)-dependent dehydrogenase (short-subunit alcohol dehydrogenase family)